MGTWGTRDRGRTIASSPRGEGGPSLSLSLSLLFVSRSFRSLQSHISFPCRLRESLLRDTYVLVRGIDSRAPVMRLSIHRYNCGIIESVCIHHFRYKRIRRAHRFSCWEWKEKYRSEIMTPLAFNILFVANIQEVGKNNSQFLFFAFRQKFT